MDGEYEWVWPAIIVAGTVVWALVIIGAFELSFAVLDYISEWRMPVDLEEH